MGEWTAGLIHELNLAPAHIVGFSLGTYVALEAAAFDPTSAASVVLLGTATAMPVHPALLDSSYADIPRASRLMTSWALGSKAHKGGHPSPGTWLVGASSALLDRSPGNALGHDMAACNVYGGAVEAASKITVPVTFILGEEDKMTPIKASGDLIEAVPNAKVVRIAGVGHMLPIEDPIGARNHIAEAIGWTGERS